MQIKQIHFQQRAITELFNLFELQKSNIVLQAPTGSGKTIILLQMMEKIAEVDDRDIAFVWLTPGAGELEEQQWEKASKSSKLITPQLLDDVWVDGLGKFTVTFVNWEAVTNKRNIARRGGDLVSLDTIVQQGENAGRQFVLIIDEEHRNQTEKAQNVIDMFDAICTVRASATPIEDKHASMVCVSEDEAIFEHLITRQVVLNEGLSEDDEAADYLYFLNKANIKRLQILAEYKKLGKNINPLVLIQFPDEKGGASSSALAARQERNRLIDDVIDALKNEFYQSDEQIGIWLSDEKINIDSIVQNSNKVNFLLIKQAVSTGWDAPRAKILVKLRLNTDPRFTLQTIGRIRRMPEQKHYDNELLDDAFVYSNDVKYVNEILKGHMAERIALYHLKTGVDEDAFKLSSIKRRNTTTKDVPTIESRYVEEFNRDFSVIPGQFNKNKQEFISNEYIFGTDVYSKISEGSIRHLADIVDLPKTDNRVPVVDTRQFGLQLEAVLQAIALYFHLGSNTRTVRSILLDLFRSGEQGGEISQLLNLSPKEWYAFVINNGSKLRDVAKKMDLRLAGIIVNEQLSFDSIDKEVELVPFTLKKLDSYAVDSDAPLNLLSKNVYEGYSTANWIKQSKPERLIEKAFERIPEVKWVYRSKDHGQDYFSVSYDLNQRDFYPDYLVVDQGNNLYIIETKGAQNENIDEYASAKFKALKQYTQYQGNSSLVKFAFVRFDKSAEILKFNNTIWTEEVETSSEWKPLQQLFS